MASPAEGAKDLAMWQKIAMLRQPVSSFSMKVVLGLERRSMKKMKMKTPIPSFEITFQISLGQARISSGCIFLPINQLQNKPARAPSSWPPKQMRNLSLLYLLSFLMQLERVTMGLMLAPQKGVIMKIANRIDPAACVSTSSALTALLKPKVKRKTARNQQLKIWPAAA